METMAGKLVNFVNDIDVTKPMVDSIVKKTWDRMPIRIDRKNEKAIYAPLPAVHVFSGNAVPSSYDRNSGAHERRWVLLEIDRYKIGEAYIQDFAHKVFDAGPQGVLNWALEGAQDNIDSDFKYHSPESSKEAVLEMSAKYDAVEQFLKDVRGEGDKFEGVLVSENGKIERKILWDNFKEWYGAHSSVPLRMTKTSFYSAIAPKLGKPYKTDGIWYFKGLCVDEDAKRKKSTGANGVGY
jgi:phage/plasmid-associated DNA primase